MLSTSSIVGTALFLFIIFGAGCFGYLILRKWFDEEPHLNALVFILLGNLFIQLISSIHFLLFPTTLAISALYGLFLLVKGWKHHQFSLNVDTIIFLAIAFAFLYIGKDFKEANSFYVIHPTNDDNYYFSALTESMIHNSYWDSYLDTGAPLNYQIISFLLPAQFSNLSGISGHLTFWAYAMPFYKMISLLLFGFSIKRLLAVRNITPSFVLSTSVLLVLTLSSLNIINLIRLKWSSLVFFASGNFWPGGNPGITLGFALMTISIFLILRAYTIGNLVIVGFCTVVIMLTKIAMWYPIMVFLGFYALLHGFKRDNLLKLGVIALVATISFLLYSVYYTSFSAAKFVIEPFTELQSMILRTFKMGSSSVTKNILFFLGYILLCFGIRIILLGLPFFQKGDRDLKFISISTIVAVVLSSLLMLPFKIYFYDLNGTVIYDSSYNLEQFLRCCFVMVSFSSVLLLFLCLRNMSLFIQRVSVAILTIYCVLIGWGNFKYYSNAALSSQSSINFWRIQVRKDIKVNNVAGELMCIVGNAKDYRAHDLAADGIGPWWYGGRTGDGSFSYFFSTKNVTRQAVVDSLMYSKNLKAGISYLQNEGVKYLVNAPGFQARMDTLAAVGLIMKKGIYLYAIKQ